jgi:hypothetical protein
VLRQPGVHHVPFVHWRGGIDRGCVQRVRKDDSRVATYADEAGAFSAPQMGCVDQRRGGV